MTDVYANMSHTEKFDALMSVEKNKLVEQLLRVIQESEDLTRTKKLHFEDRPDNVARAYDFGALPTVEFDADLSYKADGEQAHRLFIGDNIDALMGLAITEAGTYDLIYIDPPYNTGKGDFTYNDRFVPEDDAWRHSKWLSFMEPRLRLAHELLSDTGVIFVAIDNNEHHHLRALMDSVFNEQNFVANIVWQGGGSSLQKFTTGGTDYMLAYTKNKEAHLNRMESWKTPKVGAPEMLALVEQARLDGKTPKQAELELRSWLKTNKGRVSKSCIPYRNVDGRYRVFTTTRLDNALYRPNMVYPVTDPATGRIYQPTKNGWKLAFDTMQEKIADDRIIFGDGNLPTYKVILSEVLGQLPSPVIRKARTAGNDRVEAILGKEEFSFPKDHTVLMDWFRMVAPPSNAKVLDFFAGSGSTADAVLALNAEDGGTRQVTLVTNDEAGIGTNVTRERVVRVMSGENWVKPERAVALGGQLAVYRVEQTMDTDDWARSAAIWTATGRWPFVTDRGHGVLAFESGAGDEFDAVAATVRFPDDSEAELEVINETFYVSDDDAPFLVVELAPDLPRFNVADENIGSKQLARMRYLRRHVISEHSIDFNSKMQTLLNSKKD